MAPSTIFPTDPVDSIKCISSDHISQPPHCNGCLDKYVHVGPLRKISVKPGHQKCLEDLDITPVPPSLSLSGEGRGSVGCRSLETHPRITLHTSETCVGSVTVFHGNNCVFCPLDACPLWSREMCLIAAVWKPMQLVLSLFPFYTQSN